jgi:Secretion system C-terminal sorting domain
MKQLYSGALVVLTLSFFTFTASAQYTGGTYTAVTAGNWHNTSGSIWEPTEPPAVCNNCLIKLTAPGTVVLNYSVTLTGGSKLVVGGTSTGTTLLIGNSGATTWASGYNLLLDGTGTVNYLQTTDNTEEVNASTAGEYDGVVQTTPGGGGTTSYLKEYGVQYLLYNGTTVQNFSDAQYGPTMTGPGTLSSAGPLPIILGAFSAVANNGAVDLAWTTDMEINSDHFNIQSSTNAGAAWNTIGTVAAAGNSASVLNYSFVDGHPAQGTTEYRLVMVDRNGNTAYSQVVAVRIGSIAAVSVYPNPATDYVNVTLTGDASVTANIRLVNMSGQVLLEKTVSNAGGTTVPLMVSGYPAGNYAIVITGSDGSKQVNKILIAK